MVITINITNIFTLDLQQHSQYHTIGGKLTHTKGKLTSMKILWCVRRFQSQETFPLFNMLNMTQALLKAGRPGLMMMVVEISCRPQLTDTLTHPEPGLAEKTRREITTETGHSQVRGSNAEYGLSPPSTTQGTNRETQKQKCFQLNFLIYCM